MATKKTVSKKAPAKKKAPSSASANRVAPRIVPKAPTAPAKPAEDVPEPIDTAKAVEFAKSIAQAMKRSSAQSSQDDARDGSAIRLTRRPTTRTPGKLSLIHI